MDDVQAMRRMAYRKMGYEVVTYRGLAKSLKEKYFKNDTTNVSGMADEFANSLIWVDEAHNVALSPGQLEHRKDTEKERTYWALHKLFHKVPDLKVVLSTATPMLNGAGEIISLMNLLKPDDGRPPPDWNWRETDDATFAHYFPGAVERQLNRKTSKWSAVVKHFVGQIDPRTSIVDMTPETMERHFRGLFIYSRQDPVGVEVRYVGSRGKVNKHDSASKRSLPSKSRGSMYLYQTEMSRKQSDQFNEVYGGAQSNNVFFQNSRNVSNFVFPTGSISEGYSKYMYQTSTGIFKATPEFNSYLQDMNNVRTSSCKFHAIVQQCSENPGNCFIYGEQVHKSGLYVLAACFEAQGFKRYTDTSPVVDMSSGQISKPLADTDVKRYVLFTGDTQSKFSNILDLMNSKHNANGRYIKVFISSKIGREGITVKNVQQIHLMSPEWTSSGIFQATSRGIRAGAHKDLLAQTGASSGEVIVNVYLHCAVSQNDLSVDRNMYFTAERKDNAIQEVLRVAKMAAVNCQCDYDKNVRADDGSAAYEPWDDWARLGSDESSYAVLMYKQVASSIKNSILTGIQGWLKRERAFSNVQELGKILHMYSRVYDSKTIAYAVQWHLRDKLHCTDVYARPGKLEIDRGLVYYNTCSGITSQNYSDVIVGKASMSLAEMTSACEDKFYSKLVKSMHPEYMTVTSFVKLLQENSLTTVGSICLIESALEYQLRSSRAAKADLWADVKAVMDKLDEGRENALEESALGDAGVRIVKLHGRGFSLDDAASSDSDVDLQPIDPEDGELVDHHALLKYWYVINRYSTLIFQFKEPVNQIDKWYTRQLRKFKCSTGSTLAAPLAHYETEEGGKRAFGGQRSNIKKVCGTHHYKHNQTLNAFAANVLIHVLHVLDDTGTAYSVVARISKGECQTRVLQLPAASGNADWRYVGTREYHVYNPIIQSLINLQLLERSKQGIHGIMYKSSFRVCEPDPSTHVADQRKRRKGKLCHNMSADKLKSLLARLEVPPPARSEGETKEGIQASQRTKETNPSAARKIVRGRIGEEFSDEKAGIHIRRVVDQN